MAAGRRERERDGGVEGRKSESLEGEARARERERERERCAHVRGDQRGNKTLLSILMPSQRADAM